MSAAPPLGVPGLTLQHYDHYKQKNYKITKRWTQKNIEDPLKIHGEPNNYGAHQIPILIDSKSASFWAAYDGWWFSGANIRIVEFGLQAYIASKQRLELDWRPVMTFSCRRIDRWGSDSGLEVRMDRFERALTEGPDGRPICSTRAWPEGDPKRDEARKISTKTAYRGEKDSTVPYNQEVWDKLEALKAKFAHLLDEVVEVFTVAKDPAWEEGTENQEKAKVVVGRLVRLASWDDVFGWNPSPTDGALGTAVLDASEPEPEDEPEPEPDPDAPLTDLVPDESGNVVLANSVQFAREMARLAAPSLTEQPPERRPRPPPPPPPKR